MHHLIFYDGTCPLCNRAVRFVLAADTEKKFLFAPLKGETASKEISTLHLRNPDLDTFVLLQAYGTDQEKTLIEGRAALRVLWLLGGVYAWVGLLSFLPSFLFDAVYRLIARYRFKLFSPKPTIDTSSDRFLP
jgi:predicted DCC family thiol-disulfide oxidoreductase YuxK